MPAVAGVLVVAGLLASSPATPDFLKTALASASGTTASGYRLVASDGGIFSYGDAGFFGSAGSVHLNAPIVGMAATPDGGGYWLVASDGGIFTYGDAGFFGSTGSVHLNAPIVGMAATPDGGGYWLVASDGGVFTYGDAGFFGSTGSVHLNAPIVGMAATPDGGGYWLVASDGGIFTYGDAGFFGSTGSVHLNAPIVGMAATPDGGGYWLVASDGGVFTYGDAGFFGSTGGIRLNKPVVAVATTPDGGGYWLVASDGGVFTYGDAGFFGSTGGIRLNKPVVALATSSDGRFTPGGGSSPTPPSGGPPPAAAPVAWCETGLPPSPYSSPPPGAVTIPAGDDSNTPPAQSYSVQPNTIYWLAPGIHTIGSNEFAQFEGAAGDTFMGAPGAILDGQNVNDFAIAGDQSSDTDNVTVEYLTIENFTAGSGEAVVGQDAQSGWVIRDDLIENNAFGAGAALSTDGTVTDNCLQKNGEYGYTAEGENGTENHVALTNNDINDNNNAGYYDIPGSTQQCGCSGGGKFWQTIDATVTGNYIHDNLGPGIWVDTANAGFNISGNYFANNWGSAVVYEISYNASITDNTMTGNDWGEVQTNASPSFPAGTIYLANSGGDSRVASNYAGTIDITGNRLSQNWGGIVLAQDSNRICGFSADGECTLVDPSVYTLSSCKANITATSTPSQSPDYYDNCQWKTQNVAVTDNTISFNPNTLPNVQSGGESCNTANANGDTYCGVMGLFSYYGQVGPFTGNEQDLAISDNQHNTFSDNTYSGPIGFSAFNQGNQASWSQWNQGFSYSGGGSFDAQDAGSTYTP